jgi:oxygen-independent coproporphyrinogen-3 oxidase
VDGRRWQNVASSTSYVEAMHAGAAVGINLQTLSSRERVEEALFTGLRLSAGIDAGNFQSRFGVDPWSRYGDSLAASLDAGLMWRRGRTFGLTRPGMLVANEVLAAFV